MTLNMTGLQAFKAGLADAIDAGVEETARQIEQIAVGLVPVDTGALQTSIEVFGAAGTGERTVEAGQSLDYAPWVEYGTGHQAAQPFMTPAAEQGRPLLSANIARQIKALEGQSSV